MWLALCGLSFSSNVIGLLAGLGIWGLFEKVGLIWSPLIQYISTALGYRAEALKIKHVSLRYAVYLFEYSVILYSLHSCRITARTIVLAHSSLCSSLFGCPATARVLASLFVALIVLLVHSLLISWLDIHLKSFICFVRKLTLVSYVYSTLIAVAHVSRTLLCLFSSLRSSSCLVWRLDWYIVTWMDLKVHHDVPMNGPKGPSCVWSKAPFGLKKYPAVAGYLIKMEQSSTKRMP
jgi:hypothetical protein